MEVMRVGIVGVGAGSPGGGSGVLCGGRYGCGSGVVGVVGFTLGSDAWWCQWMKRSFRFMMAVSWWLLVICGASKSAAVSVCSAWSRC